MYYPNTNAILYVIDSHDKQRFSKASEELNKVLDVFLDRNRNKFSVECRYLCWPISKISPIPQQKKISAKCLD